MLRWGAKKVYCSYYVENALRHGADVETLADDLPEEDVKGFSRMDLAEMCALYIRWGWHISHVTEPPPDRGFNPLFEKGV